MSIRNTRYNAVATNGDVLLENVELVMQTPGVPSIPINSYNTVEEADAYVKSRYMASDPVNKRWAALTPEDKQVVLTKAYDILETLPFTGRKSVPGQPSAFPRWPSNVVPEAIKAAEVEQALDICDSAKMQEFEDYRRMRATGVKSYGVGNFHETFGENKSQSIEVQYGLSSSIAVRIITPWLSGGYRIC